MVSFFKEFEDDISLTGIFGIIPVIGDLFIWDHFLNLPVVVEVAPAGMHAELGFETDDGLEGGNVPEIPLDHLVMLGDGRPDIGN